MRLQRLFLFLFLNYWPVLSSKDAPEAPGTQELRKKDLEVIDTLSKTNFDALDIDELKTLLSTGLDRDLNGNNYKNGRNFVDKKRTGPPIKTVYVHKKRKDPGKKGFRSNVTTSKSKESHKEIVNNENTKKVLDAIIHHIISEHRHQVLSNNSQETIDLSQAPKVISQSNVSFSSYHPKAGTIPKIVKASLSTNKVDKLSQPGRKKDSIVFSSLEAIARNILRVLKRRERMEEGSKLRYKIRRDDLLKIRDFIKTTRDPKTDRKEKVESARKALNAIRNLMKLIKNDAEVTSTKDSGLKELNEIQSFSKRKAFERVQSKGDENSLNKTTNQRYSFEKTEAIGKEKKNNSRNNSQGKEYYSKALKELRLRIIRDNILNVLKEKKGINLRSKLHLPRRDKRDVNHPSMKRTKDKIETKQHVKTRSNKSSKSEQQLRKLVKEKIHKLNAFIKKHNITEVGKASKRFLLVHGKTSFRKNLISLASLDANKMGEDGLKRLHDQLNEWIHDEEKLERGTENGKTKDEISFKQNKGSKAPPSQQADDNESNYIGRNNNDDNQNSNNVDNNSIDNTSNSNIDNGNENNNDKNNNIYNDVNTKKNVNNVDNDSGSNSDDNNNSNSIENGNNSNNDNNSNENSNSDNDKNIINNNIVNNNNNYNNNNYNNIDNVNNENNVNDSGSKSDDNNNGNSIENGNSNNDNNGNENINSDNDNNIINNNNNYNNIDNVNKENNVNDSGSSSDNDDDNHNNHNNNKNNNSYNDNNSNNLSNENTQNKDQNTSEQRNRNSDGNLIDLADGSNGRQQANKYNQKDNMEYGENINNKHENSYNKDQNQNNYYNNEIDRNSNYHYHENDNQETENVKSYANHNQKQRKKNTKDNSQSSDNDSNDGSTTADNGNYVNHVNQYNELANINANSANGDQNIIQNEKDRDINSGPKNSNSIISSNEAYNAGNINNPNTAGNELRNNRNDKSNSDALPYGGSDNDKSVKNGNYNSNKNDGKSAGDQHKINNPDYEDDYDYFQDEEDEKDEPPTRQSTAFHFPNGFGKQSQGKEAQNGRLNRKKHGSKYVPHENLNEVSADPNRHATTRISGVEFTNSNRINKMDNKKQKSSEYPYLKSEAGDNFQGSPALIQVNSKQESEGKAKFTLGKTPIFPRVDNRGGTSPYTRERPIFFDHVFSKFRSWKDSMTDRYQSPQKYENQRLEKTQKATNSLAESKFNDFQPKGVKPNNDFANQEHYGGRYNNIPENAYSMKEPGQHSRRPALQWLDINHYSQETGSHQDDSTSRDSHQETSMEYRNAQEMNQHGRNNEEVITEPNKPTLRTPETNGPYIQNGIGMKNPTINAENLAMKNKPKWSEAKMNTNEMNGREMNIGEMNVGEFNTEEMNTGVRSNENTNSENVRPFEMYNSMPNKNRVSQSQHSFNGPRGKALLRDFLSEEDKTKTGFTNNVPKTQKDASHFEKPLQSQSPVNRLSNRVPASLLDLDDDDSQKALNKTENIAEVIDIKKLPKTSGLIRGFMRSRQTKVIQVAKTKPHQKDKFKNSGARIVSPSAVDEEATINYQPGSYMPKLKKVPAIEKDPNKKTKTSLSAEKSAGDLIKTANSQPTSSTTVLATGGSTEISGAHISNPGSHIVGQSLQSESRLRGNEKIARLSSEEFMNSVNDPSNFARSENKIDLEQKASAGDVLSTGETTRDSAGTDARLNAGGVPPEHVLVSPNGVKDDSSIMKPLAQDPEGKMSAIQDIQAITKVQKEQENSEQDVERLSDPAFLEGISNRIAVQGAPLDELSVTHTPSVPLRDINSPGSTLMVSPDKLKRDEKASLTEDKVDPPHKIVNQPLFVGSEDTKERITSGGGTIQVSDKSKVGPAQFSLIDHIQTPGYPAPTPTSGPTPRIYPESPKLNHETSVGSNSSTKQGSVLNHQALQGIEPDNLGTQTAPSGPALPEPQSRQSSHPTTLVNNSERIQQLLQAILKQSKLKDNAKQKPLVSPSQPQNTTSQLTGEIFDDPAKLGNGGVFLNSEKMDTKPYYSFTPKTDKLPEEKLDYRPSFFESRPSNISSDKSKASFFIPSFPPHPEDQLFLENTMPDNTEATMSRLSKSNLSVDEKLRLIKAYQDSQRSTKVTETVQKPAFGSTTSSHEHKADQLEQSMLFKTEKANGHDLKGDVAGKEAAMEDMLMLEKERDMDNKLSQAHLLASQPNKLKAQGFSEMKLPDIPIPNTALPSGEILKPGYSPSDIILPDNGLPGGDAQKQGTGLANVDFSGKSLKQHMALSKGDEQMLEKDIQIDKLLENAKRLGSSNPERETTTKAMSGLPQPGQVNSAGQMFDSTELNSGIDDERKEIENIMETGKASMPLGNQRMLGIGNFVDSVQGLSPAEIKAFGINVNNDVYIDKPTASQRSSQATYNAMMEEAQETMGALNGIRKSRVGRKGQREAIKRKHRLKNKKKKH